jgi:predicted AAA+ superfamily ATPase
VELLARWSENVLLEGLASWRIVVLAGARQVGKSTLVRKICGSGGTYRTLDDGTLLAAARSNPRAFVACEKLPLVVDEIQKVPELLPAIKMAVDGDGRPGQFLLTGSANVFALPTATESLAGRVRHMELCPLTQGEIDGRQPSFLKRLSEKNLEGPFAPIGQRDLMERAFRGGFPGAMEKIPRRRAQWYRDYARARIERDLSDFAKIYRQRGLANLLNALAVWSGKLLNCTALASVLGINWNTLRNYVEFLQLLYLVGELRQWQKTDCGRSIGPGRKLYLRDTGLMAALQGWRNEEVALNPERLGKFVETLVFNELHAQVAASDVHWDLFFYRDLRQREIDFILESDEGSLVGIEVKAGTTVGHGDGKHLRHFAENIVPDQKFTGIILYGGEISWRMDRHVQVVPLSALWT